MPVIDSHVHLFSPKYAGTVGWEYYVKTSAQLAKRTDVPFEELSKRKMARWADPDGTALLEEMDAAGIDRAIVNVIDLGLDPSVNQPVYDGEPIDEENKRVARVAMKYPDRISTIFGIDPRRGSYAMNLFERAVKEWGMIGLKILANPGFDISDKYCYRIYQKAIELGVPRVLLHIGSEPFGYIKGTSMASVDEVANDFPEIKFIVCHRGLGGDYATEIVGYMKTNVYFDLAARLATAMLRRNQVTGSIMDTLYHPLRHFIDVMSLPKILFATDWPTHRGIKRVSMAEQVKAITDTPEEVEKAGYGLTKEEIDAIMWKNAAEIFDLKL
jgi:predicted TIM-barrel fold metal-dependent hydrolase